MRRELYTVIFFKGDPVKVYAFCEKEAAIVAQAQKIKDGLDYVYDHILGPNA